MGVGSVVDTDYHGSSVFRGCLPTGGPLPMSPLVTSGENTALQQYSALFGRVFVNSAVGGPCAS